MKHVYIIRNQQGLYLDKSGEWVDGEASKSLFRTSYKDEAINFKVEYTVKFPELRLTLVEAEADLQGKIQLPAGQDNLATNNEQSNQVDDKVTEQSLFSQLKEGENDETGSHDPTEDTTLFENSHQNEGSAAITGVTSDEPAACEAEMPEPSSGSLF